MQEYGDAEAKQQISLRKKMYEYGESSAQSGKEY
jgi:hypothetical protein